MFILQLLLERFGVQGLARRGQVRSVVFLEYSMLK